MRAQSDRGAGLQGAKQRVPLLVCLLAYPSTVSLSKAVPLLSEGNERVGWLSTH